MKNIKFRTAHYTVKGKFSHFSYWGTIDHKQEFSENVFTSPSTNNAAPKKIHDLYSGLKDINGKEIYEGDIVSYFNVYNNKTYKRIVKWVDDYACFGLFDKGDEWCKEMDWVSIELLKLVGNIHEKESII